MSLLSRLADRLRPTRATALPAASVPYSGQPQPAPNIPPPDYNASQVPAREGEIQFRAGYHDRTMHPGGAPISFGGITLDVARAYIEEHDQGTSFYGSWLLCGAVTRFAPVYSALAIRMAPAIALDREVRAPNARGLCRVVCDELTSQLAPGRGLSPSQCFPSILWGTIDFWLTMMGFVVLQHVYGPEDARGVRKVYTRIWPAWAVQYQAWRNTYVAITTSGPVDIVNDGKFTLVGKTDIPHLQGAIRALVLPVFDGVQVQQARAQWIDRYSDPKLVGYMPQGVAVRGSDGAGDAFFECMATLRGPGGFGALPYGSKLEAIGLDSKASTSFTDALSSDSDMIFAVLVGTDLASPTPGVYTSPLLKDLFLSNVGAGLAATERGVNAGHVAPYIEINYAAGREEQQARGTWVDPVFAIPLPDADADARRLAKATRIDRMHALIKGERDAGGIVDQDRVDAIAADLDVEPMTLALVVPTGAQSFVYDQENGVLTINQRLEELGKPLDTTGRGAMTVPEYHAALAAQTEKAKADAQAVAGDGATTTEPAAGPAQEEQMT